MGGEGGGDFCCRLSESVSELPVRKNDGADVGIAYPSCMQLAYVVWESSARRDNAAQEASAPPWSWFAASSSCRCCCWGIKTMSMADRVHLSPLNIETGVTRPARHETSPSTYGQLSRVDSYITARSIAVRASPREGRLGESAMIHLLICSGRCE